MAEPLDSRAAALTEAAPAPRISTPTLAPPPPSPEPPTGPGTPPHREVLSDRLGVEPVDGSWAGFGGPWYGAAVRTPGQARQAADLAARLHSHLLPLLAYRVDQACREVGLRAPACHRERLARLHLFAGIARTMRLLSPRVFEADPARLAAATRPGARAALRERRTLRRRARAYWLGAGHPDPAALHAALTQAADRLTAWTAARDPADPTGRSPWPPSGLDGLLRLRDECEAHLTSLRAYVHVPDDPEPLLATLCTDGDRAARPAALREDGGTTARLAGAGCVRQVVTAEVGKVVELVLDHARARPEESLGVIALGPHHAEQVERALRAALLVRRDPFFAEDAPEPFFVRTSGHPHDDERDAIIVTVGQDERPPPRPGGVRVTARHRLTLVIHDQARPPADLLDHTPKPFTDTVRARYGVTIVPPGAQDLAPAHAGARRSPFPRLWSSGWFQPGPRSVRTARWLQPGSVRAAGWFRAGPRRVWPAGWFRAGSRS